MTLWNVFFSNQITMDVLYFSIDLKYNGISKFFCIILLNFLMVIHDVPNHLSMKRDWMLHSVLESNIFAMTLRKEVFLVLYDRDAM